MLRVDGIRQQGLRSDFLTPELKVSRTTPFKHQRNRNRLLGLRVRVRLLRVRIRGS